MYRQEIYDVCHVLDHIDIKHVELNVAMILIVSAIPLATGMTIWHDLE